MTAAQPIDDFIGAIGRELKLPAAEREEILSELRAHCADAIANGRHADAVIAALGDPRMLARAYELELSLHAHASPTSDAAHKRRAGVRLDAVFRAIGVVATLGLPIFVVCTVLSVVGVTLVAGGAFAFLAALFRPLLPAHWYPPDFRSDEALIWGIPMVIGGTVALLLLLVYSRAMLRVVAQTVRGAPIELHWDVLPRWMRPRR